MGARNREILRQFLIEAVLMSMMGGSLGVLFSVGVVWIVRSTTTLSATVSTFSIGLSLGFATVVGVFFGYYPARRAAGLDPTEALRQE